MLNKSNLIKSIGYIGSIIITMIVTLILVPKYLIGYIPSFTSWIDEQNMISLIMIAITYLVINKDKLNKKSIALIIIGTFAGISVSNTLGKEILYIVSLIFLVSLFKNNKTKIGIIVIMSAIISVLYFTNYSIYSGFMDILNNGYISLILTYILLYIINKIFIIENKKILVKISFILILIAYLIYNTVMISISIEILKYSKNKLLENKISIEQSQSKQEIFEKMMNISERNNTEKNNGLMIMISPLLLNVTEKLDEVEINEAFNQEEKEIYKQITVDYFNELQKSNFEINYINYNWNDIVLILFTLPILFSFKKIEIERNKSTN